MPQPELNVSWNLDVSIINMDRKSTRRIPLVLTQGRGKTSPNTQNVAILHPSLFSFFPPFSSFSCTQASSSPGQWRQWGRQEPESQKDRNLPLRLEELWSQESGASPIAFCFPLLFCCLALMWAGLWEVYGRIGLMKPQLSAGSWKREAPGIQRIAGEWEAWESDHLKLLTDSWADFQAVRAWVWSWMAHWGPNYGIDHSQAPNWTLRGTVMEHIQYDFKGFAH